MSETKNVRKRILIAEDDPVSRRLLELFLVKWGFEVSIATTGTEALQMLERLDAPRLAILDWMMPEAARIGGPEVRLCAAADGADAEGRFAAGPGIGRRRLFDETV
jgi:CheY-like chemotaxis protein